MLQESNSILAMTATECGPAYGARTWIKAVPWIAQVVVAVRLRAALLLQVYLRPETQVIFGERGGRPAATAVGVVELVCVGLLLIPQTAAVGTLLSLAVISGAIFTHLTSLGLEIRNPATGESDGGLLFGLALIVAVGSLVVLAFRWRQLPLLKALGFA